MVAAGVALLLVMKPRLPAGPQSAVDSSLPAVASWRRAGATQQQQQQHEHNYTYKMELFVIYVKQHNVL